MAVNLTKNKEALVAAWQSVVDDKSSTNWAVYSYEGQTNVVKVVSTGKGGLEEMIEELNSGMIMYAFCRVIDKKTTLPKCLLINWQGEGAPIVRKGTCANHIRDIERLLKGAHITISARSEEDVDVDVIMEKLSRATASSYKFNQPRGENGDHAAGPVGTTYRRVIPAQEINASERDQFWQKEEIEEKQRLEQERIRHEQNRKKLEEEARKREEAESKMRDMKVTAKECIVAQQRQAEQRAEEIKNLRNQNMANDKKDDSDDEHKSRSEELRRMRSKEAQQLISQRTINARAIFEQNSSAGQTRTPPKQHFKGNNKIEAAKRAFEQNQLDQIKTKEPVKIENKMNNDTKPEKALPALPQSVSQPQPPAPQPQPQVQQQQQQQQPPPPLPQVQTQPAQVQQQSQPQPAAVQPSPPPQQPVAPKQNDVPAKQEEPQPPQIIQNSIVQNNVGGHYDSRSIDEIQQVAELLQAQPLPLDLEEAENELYGQLESQQYLYLDPNNQGMKARALYDYQAADDTEITFDPGDIITHIDAIDEGWWQGLAPDGTYGLFPANHVEVIDYGT